MFQMEMAMGELVKIDREKSDRIVKAYRGPNPKSYRHLHSTLWWIVDFLVFNILGLVIILGVVLLLLE
jgi:hypothetical protein